MELRDLHIFKTVADEGGIIRAARRLHRVQSSVSTRIKQLELSLGTALFHRDGQRLTLSHDGTLLLEYAGKLLALAQEARSALSGATPQGTLKLGALESTAASRLPRILGAYHRAHPAVAVELTTGTNDSLTAAVAARKLDAAFVVEKPANAELSSIPLFEERLVIVTSRGHRAVARPQDIQGESLITFPTGCAYRRILQRWVGARRLTAMPFMELGSYHAILACVASGTGVAIVPESVLATMHHDEVDTHALPKVYAQVTTRLVWRTTQRSPALNALHGMLRDIGKT